MLMAVISYIMTVCACLFVLGVGWYMLQRSIGAVSAPDPIEAGGVERLGAARLVIALVVLIIGGIWLPALAVVMLTLLALIASPPNVFIGRGRWMILSAIAVGVPLAIAIILGFPVLDQTLWVAIGTVGTCWVGRVRWYMGLPMRLAMTPSPTPMMVGQVSPNNVPNQVTYHPVQATAVPTRAFSNFNFEGSPEQVMDDVACGFVGQQKAIEAWREILAQHKAVLVGRGTRPVLVIHIGPPGTGRETLAKDIAERLGVKAQRVGVGTSATVSSPFVVLAAGDKISEDILAEVTSKGATWHNTIFVVIAELGDTEGVVDLDQRRLREIASAVVHPKLVAMATVVPFRRLSSGDLGAIAIRLLIEEGDRVGVKIKNVAPEVGNLIVRHVASSLRDTGTEGIRPAMTDLLGRTLDNARNTQLTSVYLHLSDGRITASQG